MGNSTGSGTYTGNGHATQIAAGSFLAGKGTIALRRKPLGGSFFDDAAAELDYQFPLVINRQNQGEILPVVATEVLVEATEGDQFDLYLTENGGDEDVTVRALGTFQPEVAPTIVWTYLGPG